MPWRAASGLRAVGCRPLGKNIINLHRFCQTRPINFMIHFVQIVRLMTSLQFNSIINRSGRYSQNTNLKKFATNQQSCKLAMTSLLIT